jgi:hypothetical protein
VIRAWLPTRAQFLRHTGRWVELTQGLLVGNCLESIRDDAWFLL